MNESPPTGVELDSEMFHHIQSGRYLKLRVLFLFLEFLCTMLKPQLTADKGNYADGYKASRAALCLETYMLI